MIIYLNDMYCKGLEYFNRSSTTDNISARSRFFASRGGKVRYTCRILNFATAF